MPVEVDLALAVEAAPALCERLDQVAFGRNRPNAKNVNPKL
jgi:hypothetical protein